ncbi:MAG: LuxR C-terminal-related transcriptional regulator [Pseudomonadales bacterium]|nr:LuxR C-terminal-related transcriptional regulator [Pseudomonadales bacterium]
MPEKTVFDSDISPPSFGNHLARDKLLRQLQHVPKKLTLIQAPPGYGKTALMLQMRNLTSVKSAWVNIREADNDPVNFIHKISAALAAVESEDKDSLSGHQLGGLAPSSFAPLIRSLVTEMNQYPAFNLYLNDVDFVSNPVTLELIERMLHLSRASVHFYVTATQTISFSYAQLLIENQVASINQESLRFTVADVCHLYAHVQRRELAQDTAAILVQRCEGWPAALSFAVNTLADDADVAGFIQEISSVHSAFDRYFIERIYEKQTEPLKQLMLRLSLLDRFSISLGQLLSDDERDSRAFSEYIKNHTFVTPIGGTGHWYRFHQLFHLFLKSRCEQELPASMRAEYELKAAHWFADEGLIEEAIQLAIQANAPDQAAQWMEQAFPTVVVRLGKHVTFGNWFLALSDEVIERSPWVRIGYMWSLTARREYLKVAEQISWLNAHKKNYPEAIQSDVERTTSLIICAMKGLQDDAEGGDPLVTQWLAKWKNPEMFYRQGDYHYELGLAYLLKGFCAKCLSDFKGARFALNESLDHFRADGTYYGQTWAKSLLAVNYAKQGFQHEAQQEALEGYQLAQSTLGQNSHSGYGLAALLAAIHYEYDELDLAQTYITDTLEALKEQSSTDLLVACYETHARLLIHHQSLEEALGFLKDGIKWAEGQRLERLKYKLVDELIVWLIRLNRNLEAEQYASQYDLILECAERFSLETSHHRIAARSIIYTLLGRQQFTDAETILERSLIKSRKLNQQRKVTLQLALLAICKSEQGLQPEADELLLKALRMAAAQGYCRLFIDEPRFYSGIKNLMQQVHSLESAPVAGFLKAIAGKIDLDSVGGETLVDPLTAKESEIIQMLESGLTNKKIAEALFISEGTLKWHLHNIYSKLQVKNRTQALAEGRRLGYLS